VPRSAPVAVATGVAVVPAALAALVAAGVFDPGRPLFEAVPLLLASMVACSRSLARMTPCSFRLPEKLRRIWH